MAVNDSRLINQVRQMGPKQIVRAMNALTVGRAREFVVARDDQQGRFIAKHYGRQRIGALADGFAEEI
jgi:hypothetical protein